MAPSRKATDLIGEGAGPLPDGAFPQSAGKGLAHKGPTALAVVITRRNGAPPLGGLLVEILAMTVKRAVTRRAKPWRQTG